MPQQWTQQFIVETDSIIILNLIQRIKKPPWKLQQTIQQILDIIKDGNFNFCMFLEKEITLLIYLQIWDMIQGDYPFSEKLFLFHSRLEPQ